MPTAFMSTSTVSRKGKCDSYVCDRCGACGLWTGRGSGADMQGCTQTRLQYLEGPAAREGFAKFPCGGVWCVNDDVEYEYTFWPGVCMCVRAYQSRGSGRGTRRGGG